MADMKSTVGTVGLHEAKTNSSASVSSGADSKVKRIVVADQIATLTDKVIANEKLAASYGKEHEKWDIRIMEAEKRVAMRATSSGNRCKQSESDSSARISVIEEGCVNDLKRRSTGCSKRAPEEMYAVLPRLHNIDLVSQRLVQSATHTTAFDTSQPTAPSNDELSDVCEDMDCENGENDGRMGTDDRQGSSSILGDFRTIAGSVEQDSVVDPSSLILTSQHPLGSENPDTLLGSGTSSRSHLSIVQNTGSSSLVAEPTSPVAADQWETQHGSMRTLSYTITPGRMEVLDSKAVRSATVCEEESMTSLIITASSYVDAAIYADDAIIELMTWSRLQPVENASAVTKGTAVNAHQIIAAAMDRLNHIVVVSSSRMWDPGGYNVRAKHSSVHTARSRCAI